MQRIPYPAEHWTERGGNAIVALVVHATGGGLKSSLSTLKTGDGRGVSIHVLIDKDGTQYVMLPDEKGANHLGALTSSFTLGGRKYQGSMVNRVTLGVELVNLQTGRDPYPPAQLLSLGSLINHWRAIHGPLPILRHADLDPTRRRDPYQLTTNQIEEWAAQAASVSLPTQDEETQVTATSLLLSPPRATEAQCVAAIRSRPNGNYNLADVETIVRAYFDQAAGIDPLLAISQCIHETSFLSSWWAARPRRNSAGLGVTGETSTVARPGYIQDGTVYRRGLSFPSWRDSSAAHLGRLLAYALPEGGGNAEQQALIQSALSLRPLPLSYRGAAPTLAGLNGRWAVPGRSYDLKIAEIANQIRGVRV